MSPSDPSQEIHVDCLMGRISKWPECENQEDGFYMWRFEYDSHVLCYILMYYIHFSF